jgi:hypothetical protein
MRGGAGNWFVIMRGGAGNWFVIMHGATNRSLRCNDEENPYFVMKDFFVKRCRAPVFL